MTPIPARQTVLVVDDDRFTRTALAELVHDECNVLLAGDATTALWHARSSERIDLILLDVEMPGENGYEVLRQLRNDERTADIPVVFITGATDEADEERGLLLGAVDYVFKPIRPAIVQARIRNHLRMIAQRRDLEQLAQRDGLTEIYNRRYFDQALELACRSTSRTGEPLSLSLIDIDHFKAYNDTYGHGAGDDVLRTVAQTVAQSARRPYDVAARYGGEEFALLLPGPIELDPLLQRLRMEIAALEIEHTGSPVLGVVTVSIGGAVAAGPVTPSELLARADGMLYEAKRAGRNRTISSDVRYRYGTDGLPDPSVDGLT